MDTQTSRLHPGVPAGRSFRPVNSDPFFLTKLLYEVADKHQIPVDRIKSGRRFKSYFMARSEFCFRAFAESNVSFTRIGRALGKRHHTTVRSAIARYCELNELPLPLGVNWSSLVRKRNPDMSTSFVSIGEVASRVLDRLEGQRRNENTA